MKIDPSALHCAKRDRINHQPRFEARFDDEQSTDLLEHPIH
jgi:hypothetical protein